MIANADDLEVMWRILKGEEIGTLFKANKSSEFALLDYIQSIHRVIWALKETERTRETNMKQEQIDRINELYHKSQAVGLTDAEKEEQAALRKQYVADIKASLRAI